MERLNCLQNASALQEAPMEPRLAFLYFLPTGSFYEAVSFYFPRCVTADSTCLIVLINGTRRFEAYYNKIGERLWRD